MSVKLRLSARCPIEAHKNVISVPNVVGIKAAAVIVSSIEELYASRDEEQPQPAP